MKTPVWKHTFPRVYDDPESPEARLPPGEVADKPNWDYGNALVEVFAFAFHCGYADGELPPPVDPLHMAEWLRVCYLEAQRAAERQSQNVAIAVEVQGLRAENAAYAREIDRLRKLLQSADKTPAPWDNSDEIDRKEEVTRFRAATGRERSFTYPEDTTLNREPT